MDVREIRKMSRADRLAAMESLWDSLIEDEGGIPSPHWHQDVLGERKQKIEDGTAEFISLQKLRECRRT